ncbi:MAG: ABC transporter permease [Acidobacteria bacterium]|nr:ABC transporter permease [Acidobacteriota bacterium]
MRNVIAVAGKELRHYFHSPIAYLVMTVWAALCGVIFYILTAAFVSQALRMQMMGGMGAPPMSINEFIVRPMLQGILMVVLLFLLPLVTMRLYAEEKRSGTIELLLTSPLTDMQIILGKFLGALVLYSVLVAITFLYLAVLFFYGNPNARPLIANALGLLLFGAALLALGMWFSTFTKNQIIAGVLSMVIFLLLFIADWPQNFSSSAPVKVLAYMSLSNHLDNFAKGVIDLGDVVYYLSGVALGIFLTARSVDALKGRA